MTVSSWSQLNFDNEAAHGVYKPLVAVNNFARSTSTEVRFCNRIVIGYRLRLTVGNVVQKKSMQRIQDDEKCHGLELERSPMVGTTYDMGLGRWNLDLHNHALIKFLPRVELGFQVMLHGRTSNPLCESAANTRSMISQ